MCWGEAASRRPYTGPLSPGGPAVLRIVTADTERVWVCATVCDRLARQQWKFRLTFRERNALDGIIEGNVEYGGIRAETSDRAKQVSGRLIRDHVACR